MKMTPLAEKKYTESREETHRPAYVVKLISRDDKHVVNLLKRNDNYVVRQSGEYLYPSSAVVVL